MGEIINLNEYLENKKIEDIEETLDGLDFSNPVVTRSLMKSILVSHLQYVKKSTYILEVLTKAVTNNTELLGKLTKE